MIVFVNGAFGVGKTTVATLVRERVPGSAIFDPERIGYVLRRLPRWIPLRGRGTDDYQDLPLWRRSSILGIRATRARRPSVIVPMAFSNLDYLREFVAAARRFDPDVRHFCLVAPESVVLERLSSRGDLAHPALAWQVRRARECCAAHRGAEFAEHIATAERAPAEIAAEIAARLA